MRRVIPILLMAMAVWPLSGCSTVYVHAQAPEQLYPYKGSQTAFREVGRAWQDPIIPGEAPVRALIDLPLCVATDTLLLPVDWLIWLSNQP
ncbi:MAG TPA: YceK/YidQ family lipoprotein [Permianibacter sp.]|nr:YceK/YidQ family lipoprotein [Permianibacter sp.]